MSPVICFGQQPCGFFPRRYLYAKVVTARRLQRELGGEIVYFFHDSDHDPRELRTTLRHRKNDRELTIPFEFENRLQRKFSPLHLKRVPAAWHQRTLEKLPPFVPPGLVEAFAAAPRTDAAGFCLDIYRRMGLLDGIRVVRSSDPAVRRTAVPVDDFFVDVAYQGEIVRARRVGGCFRLHEGGDSYLSWPETPFDASQVSPSRDTRFRWMQSVVHCTHYVAGAGEQQYLDTSQAPEVTFVPRDTIERPDEAWTDA